MWKRRHRLTRPRGVRVSWYGSVLPWMYNIGTFQNPVSVEGRVALSLFGIHGIEISRGEMRYGDFENLRVEMIYTSVFSGSFCSFIGLISFAPGPSLAKARMRGNTATSYQAMLTVLRDRRFKPGQIKQRMYEMARCILFFTATFPIHIY